MTEATVIDASAAVEFWRAIQHGDRELAQTIGGALNILPVTTPAFVFLSSPLQEISGTTGREAAAVPQGTTTALTPKSVQPDTPATCLVAWNSDTTVTVRFVVHGEICGARKGEGSKSESGNLDFAACALSPAACEIFSHKGDKVARLELPAGVSSFVICL